MLRITLIEQILRHVYGELPTDDSNITSNLVNVWITEGIGIAAKKAWAESIQIDGISYLNNSFYTTFKGLTFTQDENFIYKLTLPQIPLGLGKNEGISSVKFKDTSTNLSLDAIPLSENQWAYYQLMPVIPNKILYKSEGIFIYAVSTLLLDVGVTATVVMASGGDPTNLNSILNVPDDYIPIIIDYCANNLTKERLVPKDLASDGIDRA